MRGRLQGPAEDDDVKCSRDYVARGGSSTRRVPLAVIITWLSTVAALLETDAYSRHPHRSAHPQLSAGYKML